jgi:hypothetical protein
MTEERDGGIRLASAPQSSGAATKEIAPLRLRLRVSARTRIGSSLRSLTVAAR